LAIAGFGMRGGRRVTVAWTIALAIPVGYLLLLWFFDVGARSSEKQFGSGGEHRLNVYVEPLAVDAVKQSMQVRIDFAPAGLLRGLRPDAPAGDLTVVLSNADVVRTRVFQANETMTAEVLSLDLDEAINRYPFDRYHAALRIRAFEGTAATAEKNLPVPEAVTVWEGVL